MTKKQRLGTLETYGKTKIYCSEQNLKIFIFCYIHRSLPYTFLIQRNFYLLQMEKNCRDLEADILWRERDTDRDRNRDSMKHITLNGISIKPLLLKFREPRGSKVRKSTKVRRDGRLLKNTTLWINQMRLKNSQNLKQKQSKHDLKQDLHIYYSFQLSIYVGLLRVWISVPLILLPIHWVLFFLLDYLV